MRWKKLYLSLRWYNSLSLQQYGLHFSLESHPLHVHVLPMHKAIVVCRGKYNLKYPSGLITWTFWHWLATDGSAYIQITSMSTDIVLSPIQDLLTKRGHINLTDWMQEDWYSLEWYLSLFTCLCHTLVYCRLVCQRYVLSMCSTYPPFALIGHAPRDL